jgi:acyl-CoA thioester hydrolase
MENILSGYIEKHVHHLPIRVYYSDTDAGGIIYHSRYLDMAEHGRTELLRLLGGHQKEIIEAQQIGFVVKSIHIDYKSPGKLDDLLHVKTTVDKCERVTVIFHQEICRGDEILSVLNVKVCSVSMDSMRPVPMPDEIKKELTEVMV